MDPNFPLVWHRITGTTWKQREWSEAPLFIYHRASMSRKSNSVPERIGLAPDHNFLARSPSPPCTHLHQPPTLLCPAQNTWHGGGSGIWPIWLPPAAHCLRQLGCLALPLHQLPVAPPRCRGGLWNIWRCSCKLDIFPRNAAAQEAHVRLVPCMLMHMANEKEAGTNLDRN